MKEMCTTREGCGKLYTIHSPCTLLRYYGFILSGSTLDPPRGSKIVVNPCSHVAAVSLAAMGPGLASLVHYCFQMVPKF
jgi:hypothetical protein